jgi:hypothetical protein
MGNPLKRTILIGGFVAVLLASLSGCSGGQDDKQTKSGSGTAGAAAPPSSKPEEQFASAVAAFNGKNVKFTIVGDDGVPMTGNFDSASGGTRLTGDLEGTKMEVIGLGDDVYLGGLTGGDTWMHAQAPKFKDSAVTFLILADPLFGQKFLSTATGVKQDQPTTYSGTIDLTKVTAKGSAKRLADSFAKAAGASATALPFTATMDGSNALSTVKITFPKADVGGKDLKYDLKVNEVGGAATAVAVPPKNKVTEAPADIYTGL